MFLRPSWSAVRISQFGTQQGGAAWSLRERCASEGQEWQDRFCCREMFPVHWYHQPSAFLMREMSSLSHLQSIRLKKNQFLGNAKVLWFPWCIWQEQECFTSVSYPNCDVASVVLFDYLHNSFFGYIEQNTCELPAAAGLHPRDGSISVVKSHWNVLLIQTLTPLNLKKKPNKTTPSLSCLRTIY